MPMIRSTNYIGVASQPAATPPPIPFGGVVGNNALLSATYAYAVSGGDIRYNWATLQPNAPTGVYADDLAAIVITPIVADMNTLQVFNNTGGHQGLAIRPMCGGASSNAGRHAPQWLYNRVGGQVAVSDSNTGDDYWLVGTSYTFNTDFVAGADANRYKRVVATGSGGMDPGLANIAANPTTWQAVDPTTLYFKSDGTSTTSSDSNRRWQGQTSTNEGPVPKSWGAPSTTAFSHAGTLGDPYIYTPVYLPSETDLASAYGWFQYLLARKTVTLQNSTGTWVAGAGDGSGTTYTLDSCPIISYSEYGGAMTIFAESMILSTIGSGTSVQNRANYTAASGMDATTFRNAHIQTIRACMSAHVVAWPSKRLGAMFSSHHLIDGNQSSADTNDMMTYWRTVGGTPTTTRASIGMTHLYNGTTVNGSQTDTTGRTDYDIQQKGGPYIFQAQSSVTTEALLASAITTGQNLFGPSFYYEVPSASITNGTAAQILALDSSLISVP